MPVGFSQGLSFDRKRTNWSGTGPRPLAWCAWYPADDNALEIAPSSPSWFKQRAIAPKAPIKKSPDPLPLVLLSHGSGGVAAGLEWLGHRLAQAGFVALGIDHHGHTGSEPYRAEGFLCLWERTADLTALLDNNEWREALGGVVENQASVAGFSAGAYTAMLLSGARVTYSQFEPDNPQKSPVRGPREFPDLVDHIPSLLQNEIFRKSWNRRRDSFKDDRLKAALAIAPGRSVLGFAKESLKQITAPVHIIGGDADVIAPASECCSWLHENVKTSSLEILEGEVGHYTFLPEPTPQGLRAAPDVFADVRGLVREHVHDHVAKVATTFFSAAK
ncbi:alpha/beta hydrolase family protein [Rhizobium sp. NPDC090279]|uniref:alpha/beta hydrolase family protein n=1 Tax=Rhizobium sp. NPDC090279 TaxID=3364499 RepID=UPI00383B156F